MGLTRAQRFNRFADRVYAQKAEWDRIAEETHRWGDYSYRDCMEYATNYRKHIEALAEEAKRHPEDVAIQSCPCLSSSLCYRYACPKYPAAHAPTNHEGPPRTVETAPALLERKC